MLHFKKEDYGMPHTHILFGYYFLLIKMASLFYLQLKKLCQKAAHLLVALLQDKMNRPYVSLVMPYKTLAYFVQYFDTIEQIEDEQRRRGGGGGVNTKRGISFSKRRLALVRLVIAITFLKCLHFILIFTVQQQQQQQVVPEYRVLLFDFVTHITGRVEINLGMAFVSLMTGYFYQLMYLANNNPLTAILRGVLVHGERSFFLEPYHRRSGRPLNELVVRVALLLINGLQSFIFAIGKKITE